MIAVYLRDWADEVHRIATTLGATLVVLGRDAWPIVAWLRSRDKPCQYFLCSRLQAEWNDKSTRERWLTEVPPGSFIVDTGFRGSIIEWIRGFDETVAGGALMAAATSAAVPQVGTGDHQTIVQSIEHLPKHHERTTGFDANGIARQVDGPWSDDDSAEVDSDRAGLTGYLLLREMGLSVEQARFWSRFTGLIPVERVGVADHGELREHLLQVRRLRREFEQFSVAEFLRHGQFGDLERVVKQHAGQLWTARHDIMCAAYEALQKVNELQKQLERCPAYDVDQLEDAYRRRQRWLRRLALADALTLRVFGGWHREP